jgi:hypothetical protein
MSANVPWLLGFLIFLDRFSSTLETAQCGSHRGYTHTRPEFGSLSGACRPRVSDDDAPNCAGTAHRFGLLGALHGAHCHALESTRDCGTSASTLTNTGVDVLLNSEPYRVSSLVGD